MNRYLARPALVPIIAMTLIAIQTAAAFAQIRGEVRGPGATRMPIAVPDLLFVGGERRDDAARRFVETLRADLIRSGLFRVIDPAAYILDPSSTGLTREDINFENWRTIGALGLVLGGYEGTDSGIQLEARFFDVADRSSTGGRRLSGGLDDVVRLAHRMADAVIEFVTGKPGPFDSRIAFIADGERHFREVYSFAFEEPARPITRHHSITMAPSWHPSGDGLLFTSFRGGKPVLYSVDHDSGQDSRLASKMGVNVGGVWAPDGKRLLLARENAGNTDIYLLEPGTTTMKQLTTHWGIDVNPSWSPDGEQVAFCSSRSGSPQIYTMSVSGENVRRLTFDGKYNCAPEWSPDGRNIAYAGQRNGRFQIFVMPATGGPARQITVSGSNEDPSWSPDSRYLVFAGKRGRYRKLYMIDILGRSETQLTTGGGDDSSPSWSGRLD